MMGERDLIGGALLNGSVVETYPACTETLLTAGWEFVGYSYTERALPFENDEAEAIERSL